MTKKSQSKKYLLLHILLIAISSQLIGQSKSYNGNPDASFETARKLAFSDNRKQAQDTLISILSKYPNYNDVRSFLATTYSWDAKYDQARTGFKYVIDNDSQNKSNWIAAIKNEFWSNSQFKALELSKKALQIFPNDPELLNLKASALASTNNPSEAMVIIPTALEKNLYDEKSLNFQKSLNSSLRKNTIGATAEVNFYSETFDPMQYHTLKYARQTKYGSGIAKLNYSNRFGESGLQYEVDLYPKIAKGMYAYVNFGFSNSSLYPDYRYSLELFKSLPKSFEISVGFRALQFSTTTMIYTGAITWYNGNDYWSLRPYFTPADNQISKSFTLSYRKYRSDANNYFALNVGVGISPEPNQNLIYATDNRIVNLKSQRINVGYYFTSSSKQNAWGAQAGLFHQEKIFDQGNFFWIYSVILSWDVRFK